MLSVETAIVGMVEKIETTVAVEIVKMIGTVGGPGRENGKTSGNMTCSRKLKKKMITNQPVLLEIDNFA